MRDLEVWRKLNWYQTQSLLSCISRKVHANFKYKRLKFKNRVVSWVVEVNYSGIIEIKQGTTHISEINSFAVKRYGKYNWQGDF